MKWLVIFSFLFISAAQAQTVSVKSGEHGRFTRLVVKFPNPVDWTIGRSSVGYGLRVEGERLTFNLSGVYDRITKDRLRSIWVDPATGDLTLGVNCSCHLIPFELAGNTLVVDIRDGAPPEKSVFEISLDTNLPAPPLAASAPPRPAGRRPDADLPAPATSGQYDWLADLDGAPAATATATDPAPTATRETETARLENDLRLDAFRTMLIDEFGRGATNGVIDMERPKPAVDRNTTEHRAEKSPKNARVALDALPGVTITPDKDAPPGLTVDGSLCPDPAEVGVWDWSEGADPAAELARARANLLSEFDVPAPDNVLGAIKAHLYFGFGAEARSLMTTFLAPSPQRPILVGLSYLLEGDIPPQNPFVSMESCESAAALWALLAAPQSDLPEYVNGAAVSRSFLGLPTHLRALLGPETAQRLLKSGDPAHAEVVKRSFERSVAPDAPAVGLLAAKQALASGNPAEAEASLTEPDSGEAAMAVLLAKTEARFQQRKPVDAADIVALQAFAYEHGAGPQEEALARALAHATALGGDYAAAFAHAKHTPALQRDVWTLIADLGGDRDVLTHAVGLAPAERDALPPPTRAKITQRLLDIGLPNAAADWASADAAEDNLAARVALANGDARGALRRLASNMPKAEPDLLGTSYAAVGAYDEASQAYQSAGKTAEAERMQRWNGNWAAVSSVGDDPWSALAAHLVAPDNPLSEPPLQASQHRLAQSAATRQAIAALLEAAPPVAERAP